MESGAKVIDWDDQARLKREGLHKSSRMLPRGWVPEIFGPNLAGAREIMPVDPILLAELTGVDQG